MKKPTIAAKLRKLATDCRSCRHGYCCGQCLCCMPEEKLRSLVQDARKDARKTGGVKKRRPRSGLVHAVMPTAADRNAEQYKTTKDLAALFGLSESKLVRLLKDEKIDGVHVVDGWLARESSVADYLRKGKPRTKHNRSKTHAVKHTVTPRFENDGYRGHCTCGWISDSYSQLEATGRAAASHLRQVHTAQVTP